MNLTPGKTVGPRTYLHIDAASALDAVWTDRWRAAERIAGLQCGAHYNLIRLDAEGPTLALLHYPEFFDEPFPALRESWLVDLDRQTVSYRTYADSRNPPILHRKELMLPDDHPRRAEYAALTEAAATLGLFDRPTRIGYQRQWRALVREKGYRIAGHALIPLGNDETESGEFDGSAVPPHVGWQAARQLTALTRSGFSAPVQSLARHGFLDGRFSLFDYGCGRGDDVRGLTQNGLPAAGWDPYYAPDQPIHPADIVNLGFVVNVIEDFDERLEAVTRAWALAERLLVVAVMLANQNEPRGQRFRDGVLTQRGTFQKYYTQAEIKAFIQAALDQEPIPVAPGVLYVFRDQDAEQRFLVDRYRNRRNLPRGPAARVRERATPGRRDRNAEKYETYRVPLDRLWERWVALGRPPDQSEVEDRAALTEGFGSLGRALRFVEERHDADEIEHSRHARIADLQVYLALSQFERRRPYPHLEPGLQRDFKAFFGDYTGAQVAARELLFRGADVVAITQACQYAAERGLGWLEEGRSLQLHSSLVEQLPPLLRVYVGCAAVLYGDYCHADLVKIHIGSGKVSLMRYDDFAGQPLPRMIERVKIKLREQDIDYFAYGEEYEPPFLYHKSRYVNEEFPHYPEQAAFEETLEGLELFDFSGYGPPPTELRETLAGHRWTINGFTLGRSTSIPELDDPCGAYLTFRQMIECGETQARTGLANRPQQPDSYTALLDLALNVLDPAIDYFGMIHLTYGFCSPALAREIPGRIDPKRDQHAAHELNRRGQPVCARRGAAVDFLIEDENMLEVAQWIVAHTPFDRLYFYGPEQPLHVSFGPNHDREIVCMVATPAGRRVPRVLARESFLAMVAL
ncbi:MAG: DNA phosphorothioation-associated putative methyltransferase [Candidatus Competibacteraceae bacterium]|nr:MAG: DNA phosphorothioation-associated putative methyltransferase [Candidatus Competibacteraceae bacterium]